METTNLTALLSNLRHATEFWNAVKESDTTTTGVFSDAREWLTTAALALGNALIAQREAAGGDHE
ncbi:TPA: hypothetical protein L4W63_003059 [Pseudomonas aeruginosa]|nr:hypothetical protein [Pseudomonas aeruginosa]